jgi:hypothetical protein
VVLDVVHDPVGSRNVVFFHVTVDLMSCRTKVL